MTASERLCDKVRGIRYRNVVYCDVSDAMLRKPRRQNFSRIFRIAINGGVSESGTARSSGV